MGDNLVNKPDISYIPTFFIANLFIFAQFTSCAQRGTNCVVTNFKTKNNFLWDSFIHHFAIGPAV